MRFSSYMGAFEQLSFCLLFLVEGGPHGRALDLVEQELGHVVYRWLCVEDQTRR